MISTIHLNEELNEINKAVEQEKNTSLKASLKLQMLSVKLLKDIRTNQSILLKALVDLINTSKSSTKQPLVNITDYKITNKKEE